MAMKFEFLFKNLPSERPPRHDIAINPKVCYMTALGNFCVVNRMKLKIEHASQGDSHMPQWTSTCFIDDHEYGKACAFTRKSADKEAAYQTIQLFQERGIAVSEGRNYYPIFMDFLAEQNLEHRVAFEPAPAGPDHNRTWKCKVFLDGIEVGEGTGPTKKAATEDASMNAAIHWP